jgi:hypothetical protein
MIISEDSNGYAHLLDKFIPIIEVEGNNTQTYGFLHVNSKNAIFAENEDFITEIPLGSVYEKALATLKESKNQYYLVKKAIGNTYCIKKGGVV